MSIYSSRAPFATLGYDDELNVELSDRPQNNPTNPILLSARGQLEKDIPLDYLIHTVTDGDMIRLWHRNYNATARHVRHAQKVLTRLAALEKEES